MCIALLRSCVVSLCFLLLFTCFILCSLLYSCVAFSSLSLSSFSFFPFFFFLPSFFVFFFFSFVLSFLLIFLFAFCYIASSAAAAAYSSSLALGILHGLCGTGLHVLHPRKVRRKDNQGGSCISVVHDRRPRIPTMPGPSTSGFHRRGTHLGYNGRGVFDRRYVLDLKHGRSRMTIGPGTQ